MASAAVLLAVAIPFGVVSCDKVPLLAPTGTVLTLLAAADTAQLNSSIDIIATAIENGQASSGTGTGTGTTETRTGAGTPVQNGTVITFTTTIGQIEPLEARTHNGQVTVKLITTGQSGVATVTRVLGRRVDEHPDQRRQRGSRSRALDGSPQTLGPSGGTSTVNARVENVAGAGVPGVAVTFTRMPARSRRRPPRRTATAARPPRCSRRRSARTITANIAGKTATVVVGPQSAHRGHARRADDACRGGCACVVHRGRVRHGEHTQRHHGLRRRFAAVAGRVERIDNGAAHVRRRRARSR